MLAKDDSWITVKPNGKQHKGSHVKLNNEGRVVAGMGGKFNGVKINEARSSFVGPRTPTKTQRKEADRKTASQKTKMNTAEMASFLEALPPSRMTSPMAAGRRFQTERAVESLKKGEPELPKLHGYAKKSSSELDEQVYGKMPRDGSASEKYESLKKSAAPVLEEANAIRKSMYHFQDFGNAMDLLKKNGYSGNDLKDSKPYMDQFNNISIEHMNFLSYADKLKKDVNKAQKDVQAEKYQSKLQEGFEVVREPYKIDRETEKAVLLINGNRKEWFPKSAVAIENGEVIGGAPWAFQKKYFSMDAAFLGDTAREFDENGYLHVSGNRITKAVVNPYYGHEIPGWEEAGLDPEKIYYGFRDPEELEKAVSTFRGLPLQLDHHPDSAADPQKQARVGAVGTDVQWQAPYIVASLCVWDADAIEAIESGRMKELSCAYRYDPDFTPGTYEGQHYDFVMRDIRGNHVALVEEGRAGPDVVVADSKKRGGITLMAKLKNFFRGAQDEDPAIEQQEVDLAQAIIDLHRVDPMTGQLVDVVEDEDKNAEIRRLMDELSATMTPEQAKRLKDALSDLAYSKPTGDAEGSNAEFAEGVEYGEKLERDPAERRKLDREHESEGMKKAMDECGLDADDPASSKAFAEGVKYGEKLIRNPEERKKIDREHEREGMEKKYGMDAAAIRRDAVIEARRQVRAEIRELADAARKVRPLCGELDPMAFDSASDIYRHALESRGRDVSKYPASAWAGMVDMLLERPLAEDAMPLLKGTESMLPNLDRFLY